MNTRSKIMIVGFALSLFTLVLGLSTTRYPAGAQSPYDPFTEDLVCKYSLGCWGGSRICATVDLNGPDGPNDGKALLFCFQQ